MGNAKKRETDGRIPPYSIITKANIYPQTCEDFGAQMNSDNRGEVVLHYIPAPTSNVMKRKREFAQAQDGVWGQKADVCEYRFEHKGTLYPVEGDVHSYAAVKVGQFLQWHYNIAFTRADIERAHDQWKGEGSDAAYLALLSEVYGKKFAQLPPQPTAEERKRCFTKNVLPSTVVFKRKGGPIKTQPQAKKTASKLLGGWWCGCGLWTTSLLGGISSFLGLKYDVDVVPNFPDYLPTWANPNGKVHNALEVTDEFMTKERVNFNTPRIPAFKEYTPEVEPFPVSINGWYILAGVSGVLLLWSMWRWLSKPGRK